jgi:hypothetical protein
MRAQSQAIPDPLNSWESITSEVFEGRTLKVSAKR